MICQLIKNGQGLVVQGDLANLAINFVNGHQSFSHLQKIEDHFGKKIEQLKVEYVEEVEEAVDHNQ